MARQQGDRRETLFGIFGKKTARLVGWLVGPFRVLFNDDGKNHIGQKWCELCCLVGRRGPNVLDEQSVSSSSFISIFIPHFILPPTSRIRHLAPFIHSLNHHQKVIIIINRPRNIMPTANQHFSLFKTYFCNISNQKCADDDFLFLFKHNKQIKKWSVWGRMNECVCGVMWSAANQTDDGNKNEMWYKQNRTVNFFWPKMIFFLTYLIEKNMWAQKVPNFLINSITSMLRFVGIFPPPPPPQFISAFPFLRFLLPLPFPALVCAKSTRQTDMAHHPFFLHQTASHPSTNLTNQQIIRRKKYFWWRTTASGIHKNAWLEAAKLSKKVFSAALLPVNISAIISQNVHCPSPHRRQSSHCWPNIVWCAADHDEQKRRRKRQAQQQQQHTHTHCSSSSWKLWFGSDLVIGCCVLIGRSATKHQFVHPRPYLLFDERVSIINIIDISPSLQVIQPFHFCTKPSLIGITWMNDEDNFEIMNLNI